MTRILTVLGIIAASAMAMASGAIGRGSLEITGHDGELGKAAFMFSVSRAQDGTVSGSLQYAAEGGHSERYPDTVIRLPQIDRLEIVGNTATFVGRGELHDQPVTVTVMVVDAGPSAIRDKMIIVATDAQGNVKYQATGNVSFGDVQVKA